MDFRARPDPSSLSRDQLISLVDGLEAEIDALREATEPAISLRIQQAFQLTTQEYKLVMLLADGKPRRKDQILAGLYADRIDDPPEIKIIDVFVCKVRKKLDPHGVRIETVWGSGYYLVDDKRVLQSAIEGQPPPVVLDVTEREHPPHLFKRQHGADCQSVIAALSANMDQGGRVSFFARDLAAKTGIRRQVSSLLVWLEQRHQIKIISRPPPGGKSGKKWTVRVLVPVRAVA